MIKNGEIKAIADAHKNKEKEGIIYGEMEGGDIMICVSGDGLSLFMMLERIIDKMSELSGTSFNDVEEMIWKVRRSRKKFEEGER